MKEYTKNGILFTWDLAGSDGASFILFPSENNTPEEIKQAKAEIRHQHDVVSLSIASESDRDYLFKTEYFRDPRTHSLKWYEIEQDERIIRRERKNGTTPTQFVDKFVLPFIAQNTEKYLKGRDPKSVL